MTKLVKLFMQPRTEALKHLFKQWNGQEVLHCVPLAPSGSDRLYYRLSGENASFIGTYNADKRENQAFIAFSHFFLNQGLNVPRVYSHDSQNNVYLQTDLGDTTLFELLSTEGFTGRVCTLYREVVKQLPLLQTGNVAAFDFNICYPRHAFDRQSMIWDLNYFKYYFAKLSGIGFDEQALEDDFNTLMAFLLESPAETIMLRDFQSRNVMIVDETPYFIDFQGARKGPLHYDLASLLYDAKANLSEPFREELLELYLRELNKVIPTDAKIFTEHFYGFVLIRILQALGAYGYRGFYQRKKHFLQSIPYALKNLEMLLQRHHPPVVLNELDSLLLKMAGNEKLAALSKPDLKVSIQSFSFKEGIPNDSGAHGGGFVFDCRALPNPGRQEAYKILSGNDEPVIQFLAAQAEPATFLSGVYILVDQAVENYMSRGFTSLSVSFGCTGGQHRSVYCANQLSNHLKKKYNLIIEPTHLMKEKWVK
ncbi:MAG: phosphotransferase [Lentimicrobium sp.]|nr:phosphotransferase [Lentimicrobium sp.]MDY0024517.1 RNase adapter RapZ [Lentimicrobium sp.]